MSTTGITNAVHFDVIEDGHLTLEDTVSTDYYECRVKWRLPNTRGTLGVESYHRNVIWATYYTI